MRFKSKKEFTHHYDEERQGRIEQEEKSFRGGYQHWQKDHHHYSYNSQLDTTIYSRVVEVKTETRRADVNGRVLEKSKRRMDKWLEHH